MAESTDKLVTEVEAISTGKRSVPGIDGDLARLADLVDGCRDDSSGISSKISLTTSFVKSTGRDTLDTICALHLTSSVKINEKKLLQSIKWRKPAQVAATKMTDAGKPGLYLSGILATCGEGEMADHVDKFLSANPQANVIEAVRFVNGRGFSAVEPKVLLDVQLVNWAKPPLEGKANWRNLWDGPLPEGAPYFVKLRGDRNRKANLVFLGPWDEPEPIISPKELFFQHWKLPIPSNICNVDAGSMHPRQFDSIDRMVNLPQFHEWVMEQKNEQKALAGPEKKETPGPSPGSASGRAGWGRVRSEVKEKKGFIDMGEVVRRTVDAWRAELLTHDNNAQNDTSINNFILTKVTDVFSSLIDAATLSGAWLLIDRTAGQGSATAEVLLEAALERQRGGSGGGLTIVAIDSLERLGSARNGSRSHEMVKQLNAALADPEVATQTPTGEEKEFEIDFAYTLDEFDKASTYGSVPDDNLPFEVIEEHKRKAHGNTCDPNRKWRYFYADGMFSSATHYVIKSKDSDEFDMNAVSQNVFVYAHGDTRTYKRLRKNIQQGKPLVMLHNSGGVVTAFSWLQRVMSATRPPPDASALRGPLRFIVASLSQANWINDFGVSEMMMMRSLAESVPQLFRKNVVSVDILTDSEEQTLEVITSCFATVGGVPELGLGNAEVNVLFNAWVLQMTLCENAKRLWKLSVIFQTFTWVLSFVTTGIAITVVSLDGGILAPAFAGINTAEIKAPLNLVAFILPLISGLFGAMMAKFLWRDKWSVCTMAASQLVREIYRFRLMTGPYDPQSDEPPPGEGEEAPGGKAPKMTPKQKARKLFVERSQAIYEGCLTDLSQGGALRRKRAKVGTTEKYNYRTNMESKPTLAQWCKIKTHVEKSYYKSKWTLPTDAFLNWIAGLKPFLNQRTLKEEIRSVLEQMISDKKMELIGKPLSDSVSTQVRQGLARRLGLPPRTLDMQKAEIRQVQREVVIGLFKEQQEDEKEAAREKAEKEAMEQEESSASAGAGAVVARTTGPGGSAPVAPGDAATPVVNEEEERFTDASEAMRKTIMELQGKKYGKLTGKQKEEEKKSQKKSRALAKSVEDDYLFGALSIDSYVVFRLRPLTERLEKQAAKLSSRLTYCECLIFFFNMVSAVLAVDAVNCTEWISLTVAAISVISGLVEFTQLRNQVVSCNLALRDLHTIELEWNSLSLLKRRTPFNKSKIVTLVEDAYISVVDAHTTAASNTQKTIGEASAGEEEEPA